MKYKVTIYCYGQPIIGDNELTFDEALEVIRQLHAGGYNNFDIRPVEEQ